MRTTSTLATPTTAPDASAYGIAPFTVDADGRIGEQENHFDPRAATGA